MAGQSEDCSDSKVIQIVFNGRTFKYHIFLGGVVILFLSPMNFLTDFVLILSFKFGSYVIKRIRYPRSDILIGMMRCLFWLEEGKW